MRETEITYEVSFESVHAHHYKVVCSFAAEAGTKVSFSLPSWTPGSYLVREFAQHIIGMRVYCGEKAIDSKKTDKDTWAFDCSHSQVKIEYLVYAFDPSIRACFLNDSYAFFSGTSLFVRVHGKEKHSHRLFIHKPNHVAFKTATVATSMQKAEVDDYGYGSYLSNSYDDFVDHPVMISAQSAATFKVGNITHNIYVTPSTNFDMQRLAQDCEKICSEHVQLFGTTPFPHYYFILRAEPEGYGGIEHNASSALLCKLDDLPARGPQTQPKGYRNLLGLISHEYFHSWNVKRLKPRSFVPYNYNKENYTDLLWFFEGFTSYYDDLALCRSKVISKEHYLELLAETISRVYSSNGRLVQTLAEASFDAWIKFYRQHENSPNTYVSYYQKGSLVAFALDLEIRRVSKGTASLDDAMKDLWENFGRNELGVCEADIIASVNKISGHDFSSFFITSVHTTKDLDLENLFSRIGIALTWKAPGDDLDEDQGYLGCSFEPGSHTCTVKTVFAESPALTGGIYAGDRIIALNNRRVTTNNFKTELSKFKPHDKVKVHLFRGEVLKELIVSLQKAPKNKCTLTFQKEMTETQKMTLNSWLHLGIDAA